RNESRGYEGRARQVHSGPQDEGCTSRDRVDSVQQRSGPGPNYAHEQRLAELENAFSREHFDSRIGNSVWSRLIVNGGLAHLLDERCHRKFLPPFCQFSILDFGWKISDWGSF